MTKQCLDSLQSCFDITSNSWNLEHEIGFEAIAEKQRLLLRINELKLINFELKNDIFKSRNNIQNITKSYNKILTQYKCIKQENEIITKQFHELNHEIQENRHCDAIEPNSSELFDEMDILQNVSHDLKNILMYLQIVQNNGQYKYCVNRINYVIISLQYLVKQSSLLQNLQNTLKSLAAYLGTNSNILEVNHDLLYEIINQTKNTISAFKCVSILRVSQS